MKITNISCNQFAGVRNRSVSFAEGLNVICGKNESGKSTLVNLISRTLFQKAKLDRRSDKEFFERYFPSAGKGGAAAGDFVDGKITFETEQGSYTLSKVWGVDAGCILSTPEGMIRDQGRIEETLRQVLLYGEGVYSDLLFSSQRNTDAALQTILDAARKTDAKQEITDVVSQAFAESDGVSLDAIEEAIGAKIDMLAGKHWDFDREAPARKSGRWASGLGEILKAYYALEDAKDALAQIRSLEQEVDRAAGAYTQAAAAANTAEEACHRFQTFAGFLTVQSERKKSVARMDAQLRTMEEVLSRWPRLREQLERARQLRQELADRKVLDTWNTIETLQAEITPADEETAKLPQPEAAELTLVRKALRELQSLENKLCGMNLNAAVQMFGGHSIRITSVRTGEEAELSGGTTAITEAVRLEIPGIMVMELTPADVDVTAVREQIDSRKKTVHGIFAKYQVDTLEELEAYGQNIEAAIGKIEGVRQRISRVLGNRTMEELTRCYQQLGTVEREAEQIEREMDALCGGMDIATFIAKGETVIEGYVREHGSINDLKAKAFDLEMERRKAKESLSAGEDIPAEYGSIADPEAHLAALREVWKGKQALRETALEEKNYAAGALAAYKEANPCACQETVDQTRQTFEQIRSLLGHWLHIREVFLAQKDKLHSNPMQELANRFAHYLGKISGGTVTSEFPDGDKLNMIVYSGNTVLDYGKLSEGTKETVSLAFRLAVLDHLFPEGGGVIVFDDPFTDMDQERTARSCQLLRECALRHQVIFLTCTETYLDVLEGNGIRF